jgi:hypothetical protein
MCPSPADGTIYFRVWVSGVLALLLSIFSKMIFPECTDLCRASRPSMTRVSASYLFGTPDNSRSTNPPSPHSRVHGSLSHVHLQWTVMIFFTISGFGSFGSSLFGFLWNTFPQSAWISVMCPPRSSSSDLLQTPELRRSHSLLVCKFPKCFCCGVSVLSPPVHLALTRGTQSRHLWAYHPLVSK